MTISERIQLVLDRGKYTDAVVAGWIGVSPARISQKRKESIWDSISEATTICEMTGYNLEWLVYGTGPEKIEDAVDMVKEPSIEYLSGKTIRPITVTVDRSGKELISYVPVKVQAGYMKSYGDPKFVQKLPAFSLPNFNDNGSFRMFQVDGDSMLQLGGGGLKDGDVTICQYVEDIFSLKDNMVYVVISTEGLAIKRVINRLTTSDKALIMKSDNKNGQHPNYLIHAHQIKEVWEYKAHISRQLNFATDLWELINDLQASQAILSERVDKMDSATRAILKKDDYEGLSGEK